MKQVVLSEHGDPDILRYTEVADIHPGPGEILVRVEAAGVNFADLMRRAGFYVEPTPFPYVLGMEAAGTIAAIGSGIEGLKPGDSVLAITAGGGGYSQYALATPDQIVPLPPGFDAAASTALVVQGLTAHLLLSHAAPLQGGETVLVHAAAGGVGTLAIQVAKLMGAGTVIATAGTDEKLALAKSLGADVGVNYRDEDWPRRLLEANGGRKADIVLEMVGGDVFAKSFGVLAPFGRLVGYGASSGRAATLESIDLLAPNHTVSGFYLGGYFGRSTLVTDALTQLFTWVLNGSLKIAEITSFPLERAADAHHAIHARETTGKVVLRPWN